MCCGRVGGSGRGRDRSGDGAARVAVRRSVRRGRGRVAGPQQPAGAPAPERAVRERPPESRLEGLCLPRERGGPRVLRLTWSGFWGRAGELEARRGPARRRGTLPGVRSGPVTLWVTSRWRSRRVVVALRAPASVEAKAPANKPTSGTTQAALENTILDVSDWWDEGVLHFLKIYIFRMARQYRSAGRNVARPPVHLGKPGPR